MHVSRTRISYCERVKTRIGYVDDGYDAIYILGKITFYLSKFYLNCNFAFKVKKITIDHNQVS
jgi:CO dehydrogenase/acetyl-CoA synthase epsilon subunit